MKSGFWGAMLIFLSLFFALPASAKTLYIMAELDSLTQIKAQEKTGDEIYIHVAEDYSNNVHKNYNIPAGRLYWQFPKKGTVRNTALWQGKLIEGESVSIVFTVLERDISPFKASDQIGVMILKAKNVQGKLITDWINGPSTKQESIDNKHITKFHMDGSGSIYELVLKVSQD